MTQMESWVFGEKIPETEPQNIQDIAQMPRPGPSNRCKFIWWLPLSNTFLCHLYLSVTCEMNAIEGPVPMHCNDKVNLIGRLNTSALLHKCLNCLQSRVSMDCVLDSGCVFDPVAHVYLFLHLHLPALLPEVELCPSLFCSVLLCPPLPCLPYTSLACCTV